MERERAAERKRLAGEAAVPSSASLVLPVSLTPGIYATPLPSEELGGDVHGDELGVSEGWLADGDNELAGSEAAERGEGLADGNELERLGDDGDNDVDDQDGGDNDVGDNDVDNDDGDNDVDDHDGSATAAAREGGHAGDESAESEVESMESLPNLFGKDFVVMSAGYRFGAREADADMVWDVRGLRDPEKGDLHVHDGRHYLIQRRLLEQHGDMIRNFWSDLVVRDRLPHKSAGMLYT